MKKLLLINFLVLSGLLNAQISTTNLIAHYPFDGNGNDVSGNNYNGTLQGSSSYVTDRSGNANGAFHFNGTNSYFLINNVNPAFKPTTFPVTVSAWVRLPAGQQVFTIFKNDFALDVYSGIRITVISNGTVTCGFENGGDIGSGSRRTKTGTTNIKDNQWHLITTIIRGGSDMDIYVDCHNDNGSYSGGATTISYGADRPGIIGAYDGVSGGSSLDYSLGDIDDLYFFHRELTISEILYLNFGDVAEITSSGPTDFCDGGSVTLTASGGAFYSWSTGESGPSITVTSTNLYSVTIFNANQCSTTVSQQVNVLPNANATFNPIICAGESVSYGGQTFDTDGTHTVTVASANGCDSVITVNLTIIIPGTQTIDTTICEGQTYILPDGSETTIGGTFQTFVGTASGCGTTIITNLIVTPIPVTYIEDSFCEGSTYELPDGIVVDQPGTYTSFLPEEGACGATVMVILSIRLTSHTTINVSIAGGSTYTYPDGSTTTAAGSRAFTFTNIAGCDSIVTVNVNLVTPPPTSGCYGTEVTSFTQGLTKLGTAVNPERSIQANALGAPDGQMPVADAPVQNFVSLGFGGTIDIQFAGPIANGPGNDVKIWESSASPNAEQANIEVSQDGLNFISVGIISQGGEVDFATAFSDFINFIRITDISNPADFGNVQISDGFDVDAVECLNGAYACVASSVYSSDQKDRKDGSDVIPSRSNPMNATGTPDGTFFSLGFGGEVTLDFGSPVANGPGDDIRIAEITLGYTCANYPEKADVFASLDGINYIYLGQACMSAQFDLGILASARYIKIIDVSDANSSFFPADADGYDVDGIECLNGPGDGGGGTPCSGQHVYSYDPGLRKNFSAIPANRNDPTKALGMPQSNDTYNFVSLGFGGTLDLQFDFVIWNLPGNDIKVIETSFGNPTCSHYPETADVSASLDGLSWTYLGTKCLDGELDLGMMPYAQFIRIHDVSVRASFGSGASDGYDVDAVVVINGGCAPMSAKLGSYDNTTTPDEASSVELSVYPNPADEYSVINLEGTAAGQLWTLEVIDAAGRVVRSEKFTSADRRSNVTLNVNDLANGIYQVVATNANERLISRLVK